MKGISDSDRREVNKTMHGEGQLHTRRYPRITFRSRTIEPLGGDRYRVTGDLEIRGVTRTISFDVKARVTDETFKGSGQLRFKQSLFGYAPYSAVLGTVKVKDEAIMDIYFEADRQRAS
jgi:polyisoprenoid-binding protein YceI